jgi:hypothetical protein
MARSARYPGWLTLPADQWHRGKGVVLPEQTGGLFRVSGDSRSGVEDLREVLLGVVRGPAVDVTTEERP